MVSGKVMLSELPKLGYGNDGTSLVYILETGIEKELFKVAIACDVVLCCRVAPLQKAGIVSLIKNRTDDMTLAIGDGANDVSMIQMVDVEIGISGHEGRQVVIASDLASDFAMGQFRFLVPLLLVHGHWNFQRMDYLILYNFYKNAVFISYSSGSQCQSHTGSCPIANSCMTIKQCTLEDDSVAKMGMLAMERVISSMQKEPSSSNTSCGSGVEKVEVIDKEGRSGIFGGDGSQSVNSETNLVAVLGAWYAVGFHTDRYLMEQSKRNRSKCTKEPSPYVAFYFNGWRHSFSLPRLHFWGLYS